LTEGKGGMCVDGTESEGVTGAVVRGVLETQDSKPLISQKIYLIFL